MAFFANPYRVLFHDTMAYGSHHHVTNIKFQNLARETLTFNSFTKDGKGYLESLGSTVMLTRDAYSLNYAPVDLGVKVVTLLTSEAGTFSSTRACFRTIREDGEPVSCGYQTVVLIDKDTFRMVPAPELATQFTDTSTPYNIIEEGHPSDGRSFKDMLLQDPIQKKKIFSDEIMALAEYIFAQPKSEDYPRIYDKQFNAYSVDLSGNNEAQAPRIATCDIENPVATATPPKTPTPTPNAASRANGTASSDNSVNGVTQKVVPTNSRTQAVNKPATPGAVPHGGYSVDAIEHEPIAIVGYGCVVPGAASVPEYWTSITDGINGVVDSALITPDEIKDFLQTSDDGSVSITPDKTYTGLTGMVRKIDYSDAVAQYFNMDEFEGLVKGQKMGLSAFVEAVRGQDLSRYSSDRMRFVIGSTADGQSEYDQALFMRGLKTHLNTLALDESEKSEFIKVAETVYGVSDKDEERLRQHNILNPVLDRIFDVAPDVIYVDTACSSSIYSIDMGVKALRDNESDIVFAGGLFAPGPANSPLFAQFGGLSPTDSTPLDAGANGVVFGEGAGFVVIKRLSDAIRDKDDIKAVIRGLGKSSDGKTPSINVPRPKGQLLSLDRAYGSEIEKNTIQFVEAHATATSVGDTVEVEALSKYFGDRDVNLPKIQLQSIKSIIGHTGWASGIASIIKVCLSMEHKTYPKQHKFNEPNPAFGIETSPFHIAKEPQNWPENIDHLPRRAAINSFGFGGTNSHIVLEEYSSEYHAEVANAVKPAKTAPRVAIVDLNLISPNTKHEAGSTHADHSFFSRDGLTLPAGKFLLPDVTDDMDVSQFLASNAAGNMISNHPELIEKIKEKLAVVVGFQSKTDKGEKISLRILFQEFRSKFLSRISDSAELTAKEQSFAEILQTLEQSILDNTTASAPYTLPGLMPNLVSSRVSNLFDLKGQNLVIDSGTSSFKDSLKTAIQALNYDDVEAVMVGEIQAHSNVADYDGEFSVLMMLMPEDKLAEYQVDPLAYLSMEDLEKPDSVYNAMHFQQSYAQLQGGKDKVVVGQFALSSAKAANGTGAVKSNKSAMVADETRNAIWEQLTSSDINQYTPIFEAQILDAPTVLNTAGRSILVISDDSDLATAVSSNLAGARCHFMGPDLKLAQNYSDTSNLTEADLLQTFENIGLQNFNDIIVAGTPAKHHKFITGNYQQDIHLLEVMFLICKSLHPVLATGGPTVSLFYTDHQSLAKNIPDAGYGALSGLLKSVKRERPAANVNLVSVSGMDMPTAVQNLLTEVSRDNPVYEEIYYNGSQRHIKRLQEIVAPTEQEISWDWLTADSVVLATGGAKGVTAVLVEAILAKAPCTVVALGRTSMDGVPQHILDMTPDELNNYEAEFYKTEVKNNPKKKIVELKKEFQWYQSANEVYQNLAVLNKLPGKVVYLPTDIANTETLTATLSSVVSEHGSIDLVLHGAGIQRSSDITKKSLDVFRLIVDVKLQSLNTIYNFCEQKLGKQPRYNLLSSAFSYWGNDGQPDYGAANETLNALSSALQDENWTSIGWLGWAGIGMTSGSEYAALALNRGLRGIQAHEGQDIFSDSVARTTTVTPAITMSIGEQEFYKPEVSTQSFSTGSSSHVISGSQEKVFHYDISRETVPLIEHHTVRGVPVLPAAFLTCVVGESSRKYRPDLFVQTFLETEFIQFVKLDGRGIRELRVCINPIQENEHSATLDIELRSDFYHRSGVMLESDVLHTKTSLVMGKEILKPEVVDHQNQDDYVYMQDPYVMPGAPVELGPEFDCMFDIRVGEQNRITNYRLNSVNPLGKYSYFEPLVYLLDTNWRFSTIQNTVGDPQVYVPRKCSNMQVYFDFTDFGSEVLKNTLTFVGDHPTPNDRQLNVGPISVLDQQSNCIISFIGGECLSMGSVPIEAPEMQPQQASGLGN